MRGQLEGKNAIVTALIKQKRGILTIMEKQLLRTHREIHLETFLS
jgi:hypothetical protein